MECVWPVKWSGLSRHCRPPEAAPANFLWTGSRRCPSQRRHDGGPRVPARPGSSGVEQRTENPRVGGSNPPPGTIKIKDLDGGRCDLLAVYSRVTRSAFRTHSERPHVISSSNYPDLEIGGCRRVAHSVCQSHRRTSWRASNGNRTAAGNRRHAGSGGSSLGLIRGLIKFDGRRAPASAWPGSTISDRMIAVRAGPIASPSCRWMVTILS